ncbi:hypothetical protein M23134_03989 [Microscilla marina ATCC 23134]|uniref:Uncharacterized protein n=1 Tax=Microscilla marina ATCC 23134 TaxID=313606 RepID=A1ZMP6_MICM2|nr:hypothetical protein M23134_03989 [Microscilla marina ATCC 23134]
MFFAFLIFSIKKQIINNQQLIKERLCLYKHSFVFMKFSIISINSILNRSDKPSFAFEGDKLYLN